MDKYQYMFIVYIYTSRIIKIEKYKIKERKNIHLNWEYINPDYFLVLKFHHCVSVFHAQ